MKKKELLEVLRKLVKSNDVKMDNYSSAMVRSVLFGQRTNDVILKTCIDIALKEVEVIKSKIVDYQYTMSTNRILNKNDAFMNLPTNEKVRFICKCSNLVEVNQLKKELIKKKVFERALKGLPMEVQMFLMKPTKNQLKLLRVMYGSSYLKSKS
jgi:anti-sigma28 factor (negative regulator of flagellin synthesis)